LYQLSSILHEKFIQYPKGETQSEKSPFALKSPWLFTKRQNHLFCKRQKRIKKIQKDIKGDTKEKTNLTYITINQ